MKLYRLSAGRYINLAHIKQFRVDRGFGSAEYAIRGDDVTLIEGFVTQKDAEATLAEFLQDIGATVILDEG